MLAALDLASVHANGFGFQVEMNWLAHRAGFRLVEVPIIFPDRTAGRSKMSARITLEAALMVWRLRFQRVPGGEGEALPAHTPAAAPRLSAARCGRATR